jgi:sigma-B regulation protein RsbU (phosphoserine phosphatase)
LCALNELLHDDLSGAELFITMFYLRYDLASRQLCYANAGHNCALLLRADEVGCRQLDADGMILGIRRVVEFEDKRMRLNKGDRVLLYTDGITEAQNQAGEFFGVSRLDELFSAYRLESPEAVITRLLESLYEFCGGQSFNDDVSMVVLQVE